MFGFGAKYCAVCGTKVQRGSEIKKFDRDFCSDEHLAQYGREMKRARQLRMSRQLNLPKATRVKDRQRSHGCC